jgi:hypothetical protein
LSEFATAGKDLKNRLESLVSRADFAPPERRRIIELMALLAGLPDPPDPFDAFPRYGELRSRFRERIERGATGEALEEAFLELYAHLHMHEAPYLPAERRRMDETGGYWSHAGGLGPILKAPDWIGPRTVSADFGAGNGLQCLLMHKLAPHAKTIQIEISSKMVEIGRLLQDWLEIPAARVDWVVDDVLNVAPRGMDFIYLYRPVRPDGLGRKFYEAFAATLEEADRTVVVFSIADCLRGFLSSRFEVFYGDGHLTCFRGPRD